MNLIFVIYIGCIIGAFILLWVFFELYRRWHPRKFNAKKQGRWVRLDASNLPFTAYSEPGSGDEREKRASQNGHSTPNRKPW